MKSPKIKTILYATDMGEHMRPVFRHAIDLAQKYKANIIMLHVIEPLSSGTLLAFDVYMPQVKTKKIRQEAMKKALKTMQRRLNKFCIDENVNNLFESKIISKVKVVSGHPAETIVIQAEKLKVDLIVVGTHTKPSNGLNLLGSTARKVTQTSTIPMLIVPVHEKEK